MTSAEKKKRKKIALFNHFAANLSLTYPQYSNIFACPLCRKPFTDVSELDLAHVWPKKLGGRLVTLTCRECNNTIGSTIESYETRRAEYIQAKKLRMRMSVEDIEGSIGIDFSVNNDGVFVFEIVPKANVSNFKAEAAIIQKFETGDYEVKLNYWGKHGWDRARFTYLHFGFLYLFHHFGYQWALSEHAEQIREQLKIPDSTVYEPTVVETPTTFAEGKGEKEIIFGVIREPLEKRGFLVVTPALPHEANQRLAVWFPATLARVISPLREESQDVKVKIHKPEETHSRLDKPGASNLLNLLFV